MRVFAILSLLFVAAIADSAYFCNVQTPLDASVVPQISFAGQSYDWDLSFNAISFDGFEAVSGDVEGRCAVRNNLQLAQGQYSFGALLQLSGATQFDNNLPYSLVVGHDATWLSGAVLPDGQQYGYVGGSYTGAVTNIVSARGNLDSAFDDAQNYFVALSNAFAQVTPNAAITIQYSAANLVCNDPNALAYSVNFNGAFNGYTYWTVTNCNVNAQLVINFVGTGDVLFTGDNLHGFTNEKVIYNVVGAGRTVSLENAEIDGSLLAPNSTFDQHNDGVVKGLVVVGNAVNILQINRLHCVHPQAPTTPNPCVGFERTCSGLTGSFSNGQTVSFTNYNVISFGRFIANTSDVEGRIAAAGDVVLGAGYSVGATLSTVGGTPDASQAYSLIVGGNLNWTSGALFPNGLTGPQENAYVVGNAYVTEADLAARVVQGSDVSGIFTAAQSCYQGYSALLAAQPDNVATSIYWSGLFATCADSTADTYYMSLTDSQFAQFTYSVTDNCNFQARWIINVRGTGDVTFSGDTFPSIPGATVYNVIGARTVNVHDTSLGGHLLAPEATLNQPNGVIVGKVVVADVQNSWQINSMSTCPVDTAILINIVASGSANAGDYSVAVAGASGLRDGDQTSLGKIVSISQSGVVTFSTPFPQAISAGTVIGNVKVSSLSARAPDAADDGSSASATGVAFALFAVVALLF